MKPVLFALLLFLVLIFPQVVFAHPGNTDSSGCHTCRTNCPSWGLSYGEYHCHGGYTAPQTIPIITYGYKYETQEIPFKTTRIEDSTLLKGETYTKQVGALGSKKITYKITYENLIEKSRTKDSEQVTTPPTDEIIAVGTKEPSTDPAPTEQGDVAGTNDQQSENGPVLIGLIFLIALISGIVWYAHKRQKTN